MSAGEAGASVFGATANPGWGGDRADPEPEPVIDYALVRVIQRQVADRLTGVRRERLAGGLAELGAADEHQLAGTLIREEIAAHLQAGVDRGIAPPDPMVDRALARAVEAAIFGAGALQPLLDDPDVENIDINGTDVWVTYGDERGKVLAAPVTATDEELLDLVSTLAAYQGLNARPFTPANLELDLRLSDGSRLSGVRSASPVPVISIRRNRFPLMFLSEVPPTLAPERGRRARARRSGEPGTGDQAQTLLELGTVDAHLASFLRAAVLGRCNIVVAGATDSGKTTLLRALIHCIPAAERLVTVEKTLELGLRRYPHLHPDVVELEEVPRDGEQRGGITMQALVERSRKMNPSRVIVGEVLGAEAMEMLSAMRQGNDGSLTTIHTRNAGEVFNTLASYAARYSENHSERLIHGLIASAVDLVVFIRKNPRMGGRRAVMEVLEVTGSSDGQVTRSAIFTAGPDGRARRDEDVPIARADLLAEHGYDDRAWNTPWLDPPRPSRTAWDTGEQTGGTGAGWVFRGRPG